ncbi:transcription elongation factor [Salinimicrobium flavum]|uniref:Transcription elongation factor n=1 Tax=Salinimicrobium flavum TaxID=1737065 RepID=A0ABW5IV13_9FLAO
MESALKQKLVTACSKYVEERISRVDLAVKDLEAALKLETKCSMGDKYETGRAMLHLEFEKLAGQHEELRKLRKTLSMIHPAQTAQQAGFGAIIKTNAGSYFISIPAGELMVEKEKYYAVGTNAPIARALSGKKEGEAVTFNGKELLIGQII